MSLIEAKGITVSHGSVTALDNVSLSVQAGEIVTIVGPNGSGKTTLVRALIGALTVTKGQITRKEGLRVGYVPQKLAIDPTMPITVERFLRLPKRFAKDAIETALEKAGAQGWGARQMSALSGGHFQRILLARALLEEPELLILDEATQGLDQPGSAAFYRQIEQLRSEMGCSVLMVSHELHVVMSASDRVICLNGHVCCHGTPAIVASAPEYRALFGSGTQGALALYRHDHDHHHGHDHPHEHDEHCDHA
jgi:zinc transport system ATP-binding protein